MDDLDREIEVAAREARKKVWRGRMATIASTATFLVVGVGGTILMFQIFPEPDVSEFDANRLAHKGEDVSVALVVGEYSAQRRDSGSTRWKVMPCIAAAFASAFFVRKRLIGQP
jgi:hypothetical protein